MNKKVRSYRTGRVFRVLGEDRGKIILKAIDKNEMRIIKPFTYNYEYYEIRGGRQ